ncbi:hypothetical protein CKA32_005217 [Geitlerinema sp. FC II]|nr:hypothetical protein [Geitlerinema sp. CS-897]PPT05150.1 hypothetical protein CKA32_005217 [Geitlerinema sp. FC II]
MLDFNNLSPVTVGGLFVAHCIVGTAAAVVATRKGYALGWWLTIGLIGGTPSLVVAVLMQPKESHEI